MALPGHRLRLLALVSGFPGDKRRLRPLIMLQAHIDDSRTGFKTMVLGGYVSTVEKWLEFNDEWAAHLADAHMPFFKMSQMANSGPEFTAAFYRIIERHALASLACVVPLAPLKEAAQRFGLPPLVENAYLWAFKALVSMTAQMQKELGLSEPIDFIFDNQEDQKPYIRAGWDVYARTIPQEIKALTGTEPIFRDDKEVLPLQAADLYAWWIRRGWDQSGTLDRPAFPWTIKRDVPSMHFVFDEPDVSREFARISVGLLQAAMQNSPWHFPPYGRRDLEG